MNNPKSIKFSKKLMNEIKLSMAKKEMNHIYGGFSKWVKLACKAYISSDKNISNEVLNEIVLLRKELNHIGNNINQIAKKANTGESVIADEKLLQSGLNTILETKKISLKILEKLSN